ncbi:MAG: hypothetical protein ACLUW8_05085 [Subdoligranulum sp.]
MPQPACPDGGGCRARTHLFNGCPTSRYPRCRTARYRVYDAAGTFLGLANVTQGVLQVEKIFCERA